MPPRKILMPKGEVGPQFTKKVMPWIESFWHAHKRYPSNTELINQFGLTLLEIEKMHASKFFGRSLKDRGIRREPNEPLTDKQVASIVLLTNFADRRPADVKLEAIGVTPQMYHGWMQDPNYKSQLQQNADDVLDNVYPEAQVALAKNVAAGDFQSIKFYYELTGRANTPETLNLKVALLKLQEAIQKHVKDPAVLAAIGNDLQAALGAAPVAAPSTIPSISNPVREKSVGEKLREFHANHND